MPVPTRSVTSSEPDTYSLLSQATTTMTIGDSLPAQLVRKTAQRGFTFNIMSVGRPGLGKTTLLSALFGRNLDLPTNYKPTLPIHGAGDLAYDPFNPPVTIDSKTFELDDKGVRVRLTVVESRNYGKAIDLTKTHLPLVNYIDAQFADYHKRETVANRHKIPDKMVHCLFFYIWPFAHGLSKFDIIFLKAIHNRVNVIPIIAKAETLGPTERASFKRRIREDLEKHGIEVYQMPEPDSDESNDMRRLITEIRSSWPFAVSSLVFKPDNTLEGHPFDGGLIDPLNKEHSDFLLLKTMLHMQMPDLCETTHEVFYEDYRLRNMAPSSPKISAIPPPVGPKPKRFDLH